MCTASVPLLPWPHTETQKGDRSPTGSRSTRGASRWISKACPSGWILYRPIIEPAELFDKARFVLGPHQWIFEPDFDQNGDVALPLGMRRCFIAQASTSSSRRSAALPWHLMDRGRRLATQCHPLRNGARGPHEFLTVAYEKQQHRTFGR